MVDVDAPWGFAAETAIHTLRLILSGLFDRFPRLRVILGHQGEGLPFLLPRVESRLRHASAWANSSGGKDRLMGITKQGDLRANISIAESPGRPKMK